MRYALTWYDNVIEEYDTYKDADEAMEYNRADDRANWEIKKEKEDRFGEYGWEEIEIYNIYHLAGDGGVEKRFDTLEECETWVEDNINHYDIIEIISVLRN
ncbi:MAG: hypothetical protein SH817_09965 [Leptospira sp.]|nr:hypothetical protein [Leptospira sp.]